MKINNILTWSIAGITIILVIIATGYFFTGNNTTSQEKEIIQNIQYEVKNQENSEKAKADLLEEVSLTPEHVVIKKPACTTGGCSGQLCIEEGTEDITTCEWLPQYACYRQATCERQLTGECGWTPTVELGACLLNPQE